MLDDGTSYAEKLLWEMLKEEKALLVLLTSTEASIQEVMGERWSICSWCVYACMNWETHLLTPNALMLYYISSKEHIGRTIY